MFPAAFLVACTAAAAAPGVRHLTDVYHHPAAALAGVAGNLPAGLLRAYHTAYLWAEDRLLDRLAEFDRNTGMKEELEHILGNLVWLRSPRGIRPMIALLDHKYYVCVQGGPVPGNNLVRAARTRYQFQRPAERALLHMGDPVFLPLIDEFIRTADDPGKEAIQTRINGVIADGKWVAKALDETTRRLFAHPDDRKVVRGCKKLIRYLVAYDPNHEIHKFRMNFPPPWWDEFKE